MFLLSGLVDAWVLLPVKNLDEQTVMCLKYLSMKYDNILTILKNSTLPMSQLFLAAAELAGGCMGVGTYEWF